MHRLHEDAREIAEKCAVLREPASPRGMELLRLHRMRFIVAADVIIPAFDPRKGNRFTDAQRVYPSLQLRLGF